jgi:hypothetical protein
MRSMDKLWVVAGVLSVVLAGCGDENVSPIRGGRGSVDPGQGGVLVTVSGESLALGGYPFPPASPDDAQFYDGWNVRFERLIVTIGNIVLSANPDKDTGDQSKTDAVVASVSGPFAVDLHRDGPANINGKSAGERAVPIAALATQSNGSPFATDGTRYAFGFDTVVATPQAVNVNLDGAALGDYADMMKNACVVLYVGTATFKGDAACNAAHARWPKTVDFRLCFQSPASYLNCQNPDNTGTPFPSEESQRGIAFDAHAAVIAQITFHTDHPFWDSVLHGSPAHFDAFAARAAVADGGTPTVTLEQTRGVDYTAYRDALGNAIDWRYCSEPPVDAHPMFTGSMAFDPQSVPHAIDDDPRTGLRDYYDFATYNQSTQGHLNADGLCFVKRNYDSPP